MRAGADVSSPCNDFQSCILRRLKKLRSAQSVLKLQRVIPQSPFSFAVSQVIDIGDRLVEMSVVVVACNIVHYDSTWLQDS